MTTNLEVSHRNGQFIFAIDTGKARVEHEMTAEEADEVVKTIQKLRATVVWTAKEKAAMQSRKPDAQ